MPLTTYLDQKATSAEEQLAEVTEMKNNLAENFEVLRLEAGQLGNQLAKGKEVPQAAQDAQGTDAKYAIGILREINKWGSITFCTSSVYVLRFCSFSQRNNIYIYTHISLSLSIYIYILCVMNISIYC